MARDWLLPLLGYDDRLASQLTSSEADQLRSVAVGWLIALFLVAWPLGYVFWLTEHSSLLATLGPLGVYALCLNLLRVAVAGGGAGPGFSANQVESWRPGLVPSVFLFVIACLMAQPAQLLLTHHEHAAAVHALRTELVAAHSALMPDATLSPSAAFAASLERCEFVVFRLQQLWSSPSSAARFTALYGVLVLVPVYWSRFVALSALRAYEKLRYLQARSVTERARATTREQIHQALGVWPTYAGAQTIDGQATGAAWSREVLSADRRARRSQLILRWRAWE